MALNPGDLLFVGWDSDNDDISFITTVDIAAGEVIYFTDDEWNGTSFFGSEQLMEWTVPAGGISAGDVVTIDMDPGADTVTFDSGGAVDYIRGGYQIAGRNEMFWAFQGTRVGNNVTPTDFIAVIGNEADGNDNQTPNLSGSGLTTSNGAVIIDGDEDYMEWTGDGALSNPVDRQDLIDSILDLSNWTTADGGGNNNPNPGGEGFDIDIQTVICFAEGTRITTRDRGPVAIEVLNVGDMVETMRGALPIRWIGRRKLYPRDLRRNPKLLPVRILAGALGKNLPREDLLVSRQHWMLVHSKIAERMFGSTRVLVPAVKLTALPGIYVDQTVTEVEYFHLLFDSHEIVFAQGAPAESLFTGPEAIKAVSEEAREELRALFPELELSWARRKPACLIPPGHLQKKLVARHVKNARRVLM